MTLIWGGDRAPGRGWHGLLWRCGEAEDGLGDDPVGGVEELGDGEAEGVGEFFAVNEVRRRIGNPSACGERPLGCDVVDGNMTFKEELMCRAGSPNVAEVDVHGCTNVAGAGMRRSDQDDRERPADAGSIGAALDFPCLPARNGPMPRAQG